MLPSILNHLVANKVSTHESSCHPGVDKCLDQIAHSFYIKNLGRRVRKFIASCDKCKRVKCPNKSYTTQERSYLRAKPGDLCVLDLFGALPLAKGGVRYIFVCSPNT
jgi:hypothetical protein